MKKSFSAFAIIWALFFALFNVIVFVTPNEVEGMTKFGGAFWSGYIFITLAFIGQLICGHFALKADDRQTTFYNLSLLTISYTGLVVMLVAGTVCMVIPDLPNWVGIIVCLLILTFTAVAIVKASLAISVVGEIDQRIKAKTAFIKMLTVDAEQLCNATTAAEMKALTKKVYEAVRYSDPMSNAVLVEVEEKIQNGFADFESSVNGEDYELACSNADVLLALIDTRNKKCKLLK